MNEKILIVDDSLEICDMYQTLFEWEWFEVMCENDGLKGIMSAIEFKPDIIILDIMMPQSDGFEVLKSIKTQTALTSKIVINSNLSSLEDEKKALDLWAIKYLRKSDYIPIELVNIVKNILSQPELPVKKSKKVMIIDDNEEICEMYKIVLDFEWYDVKIEYNGLSGLTTALEFKPDIIILDIMMPQTNGFEVLESIKKYTSLDTIIIVNSNLNSSADEKRALDLWAKRYLRKSDYTPNEVVSIIKKIEEEQK